MSESYRDIPEETLHDFMHQIAEERDGRDLIDGRELRHLRAHLAQMVDSAERMSPDRSGMRQRGWADVIAIIDEMQGERR